MLGTLRWFLAWYRRRAVRTKILVALLIVATLMGCFGLLTPSTGGPRPAPAPAPAATLFYTESA